MTGSVRNNDQSTHEENKAELSIMLKDILVYIGCYVVFYTFLLGFSTILLYGAIATSNDGTVLWSFFYSGIIFSIMIMAAVCLGTRKSNEQERSYQKVEEMREDNIVEV